MKTIENTIKSLRLTMNMGVSASGAIKCLALHPNIFLGRLVHPSFLNEHCPYKAPMFYQGYNLPSGKLTKNHGKSPIYIGKPVNHLFLWAIFKFANCSFTRPGTLLTN